MKRSRAKNPIVFAATLSFVMLAAISLPMLACVDNRATSADPGRPEACLIREYGQRVIYFDCTKVPYSWAIRDAFGRSLQRYLDDHRTAVVQAVTGHGQGVHGRDEGFWVVLAAPPR